MGSLYSYVRETWKKPRESLGGLRMERIIQWRQDPATIRIERPTRLDRARALGYKAKQGFIIVRQRVQRGGRLAENPRHPRRSKRFGRRKNVSISYQVVAQQRANQKYPNCEVLNSYHVAQDGKYYWYEVILVDRANPSIAADPHINWISSQRGRVYRGLTSAGKKSRGMMYKGKGVEKVRPSLRAHDRRGN